MKNNKTIKDVINITPVKSYSNPIELKITVYKENRNKSGIYKWTNKINGKCYVGSSVKLNRRLSDYYSIDRFKRIRTKGHSLINSAILKYKILNFSLDIIEYCEPNVILKKEQYYINLLNPEYNICKVAGLTLGRKLSKEARINISIKAKDANNPM